MKLTLEQAVKKVRNNWKKRKWLSYQYYRLYINSKYWKEKAVKKRELKPYCECCGNWSQCIHHETYHRLWKERMSDLKSLCNDCHHKIHFIYNEWKNSKKTLKLAFHKLREELNIFPYWKWWECSR